MAGDEAATPHATIEQPRATTRYIDLDTKLTSLLRPALATA
jgi:hypothetical protein